MNTQRRPLMRLRAQRSVLLQRRLRACPAHPRALCVYLWSSDSIAEQDGPEWRGPGFYWTPGDGAGWACLGLTWEASLRAVREAEIAAGLRTKASAAEVFATVAQVASLIVPLGLDIAAAARGRD